MTSLSNEQKSALKQQMQNRMAELRKDIREELLRADTERFTDIAGQVHDAGDESVADLLADVGLGVLDLQIRELREIDAAIIRMQEGNYGTCVDCGVDIEYSRLEASPAAKRCLACQTAYEKAHPESGAADSL